MSNTPTSDIVPAKWLPTVRKFVTAALGAAGEAVTLGIWGGPVAKWVAVGIAFATTLGVYIVPNTP